MRTPMEIHLSLLCTSTEKQLTGNLQSTPAYKRDCSIPNKLTTDRRLRAIRGACSAQRPQVRLISITGGYWNLSCRSIQIRTWHFPHTPDLICASTTAREPKKEVGEDVRALQGQLEHKIVHRS